MGFIYRKSIRLGPFRANLSKSGIGYSVGGPALRTGVSSRGKRYTTFGLPGTGLGYRIGSGKGCLFAAVAVLALVALLATTLL